MRRKRKSSKGSFWKELPILIVTALVLTFLIQTFLARVYVIPSASMEQTLHGCSGCSNDRVLVDKMIYRFGDPSPGDVVVFRGPDSWGKNEEFNSNKSDNVFIRGLQGTASLIGLAPPNERDFVKRVIATEGQTVQCCDDRNRITVNGAPLDEPYLYLPDNKQQEAFGPVTVPDGRLWVMGDNRGNSADSRRHVSDEHLGTVSTDDVIGKARAIVLPPGRWGGIGDHDPQNAALGFSVGTKSAVPLGAGVVLTVPIWWCIRRRRHRS